MSKEAPKRSRLMDALAPKAAPVPETTSQVDLPASNNLGKADGADYANLNFKIDADFRRDFKRVAADIDLSLVDLLRQSFDAFVRLNADRYGEISPAMQRRLKILIAKD